jgi:hypothetical protein
MRSPSGTSSRPGLRAASRSSGADRLRAGGRGRPPVGELWRLWGPEQRVAAVASLLLIVSTLGPFSFVEAGVVLVAAGVLYLLVKRAEGRRFHLPGGDGATLMAAGAWASLLIVIRLFDRPLGQGLLALVCAAMLAAAGLRERSRRPPDDLPRAPAGPDELPTDMLSASEEETRRLQRTQPPRAGEAASERGDQPPRRPDAPRPAQRALPGLERPEGLEIPKPQDPPSPEELPAGRAERPDDGADDDAAPQSSKNA